MDKRTAGIIGLIATILFCGMPGLCGLCIGPFSAIIAMIPGADVNVFGDTNPGTAIGVGIAIFCVSVIFILIPVLVWYFTLREKPAAAEVVEYHEPMPDDL